MKEYIERASVHSIIERTSTFAFTRGGMHEKIDSLPAADVAEVKHGYWKPYESFPMAPSLNGCPCSECDMHFSPSAIPILHYCPNCGARMDKEDEHES